MQKKSASKSKAVARSGSAADFERTGLIKYDAMQRAIVAATAVDEVKDIRDKVKALEKYAQQARNFEAEKRCADIRIKAEMRAAEIYADQEKAKPGFKAGAVRAGRRGKVLNRVGSSDTIKETSLPSNVSRDQMADWQKMAANKPAVEKYLASHPDVPTTAGAVAAATGKPNRPKPQPAPPPVSDDALWLWGHLGELLRHDFKPAAIAKGCDETTRRDLLKYIPKITEKLTALTEALQ